MSGKCKAQPQSESNVEMEGRQKGKSQEGMGRTGPGMSCRAGLRHQALLFMGLGDIRVAA